MGEGEISMKNKLLSIGIAFLGGCGFLFAFFVLANDSSAATSSAGSVGSKFQVSTMNSAYPVYLTSTILLERMENGDIVEMLPAPGQEMVFDSFYIMPDDGRFVLWLNSQTWTSGNRVAVEQWMESSDGLVWENRVNTNLVDNTPDYHTLFGIRQVIKQDNVYEGWENYYYNVVSGMWVRGIRYITSTSGITWTVVNQTALIDGSGFSVVEDVGNYEMWVQPHGDSGYTGSRSLRYRTSGEPDSGWGDWLTGGTLVTVDGQEIAGGTRVRKTASGTYELYYRTDNTSEQVGFAVSTNGSAFTSVVTSLLNLRQVLPNFNRLTDFAVVDMNGEDWFYFTYYDTSGNSHIAVSRPEVVAADEDIVFSEIMINAVVEVAGGDRGEWIEIYNKGSMPVNLLGWQVTDSDFTATLNATNCPGSSCLIPAGACWILASSQTELQTEFNNYGNPSQPPTDPAKTIYFGSLLGDGLINGGDRVILQNSSGEAVDCYSWNDPGVCSSLIYTGSGDGNDNTLTGSLGQSVANVQGSWFNHQVNSSPYDCNNTADGGPTAVSLTHFTNSSPLSTRSVLFLTMAAVTIVLMVTAYRRR
jgi:hypothetical protein